MRAVCAGRFDPRLVYLLAYSYEFCPFAVQRMRFVRHDACVSLHVHRPFCAGKSVERERIPDVCLLLCAGVGSARQYVLFVIFYHQKESE